MSRYAAQVDNAAVFFQRMALHLLHCCLHHEAGAGHINLERLIKYDQVDTSPSLSYPSRPPWLRGFRSQSRRHSWRGGGDVQDQQQFEKQPWSSQLSLTHPTCRTLNSKVKICWTGKCGATWHVLLALLASVPRSSLHLSEKLSLFATRNINNITTNNGIKWWKPLLTNVKIVG